jgi:hypothetical protein
MVSRETFSLRWISVAEIEPRAFTSARIRPCRSSASTLFLQFPFIRVRRRLVAGPPHYATARMRVSEAFLAFSCISWQ